jgi:hypothetical protein
MVAASLSANATTVYNGDLIVGFTGGGSSTDFEYDLGAASSLVNHETWNLSSQLGTFNLASTSWGVVGTANPGTRTAWVTIDTGSTPSHVMNNSMWSSINSAVSATYGLFSGAGAGNSATPSNQDDNSWNQQTMVGALTTQYHNAYENPNGSVAGPGSLDFFAALANNGAPTLDGSFSLGANGILTFSVVPEPSTYALIAWFGFTALLVRRIRRRA